MSASSEQARPTLASLAERLSQLEAELEAERAARRDAEARLEELETQNQILRSRLDGLTTTTDATEARLNELQARELEKGAHLEKENVYPWTDDLDVETGRLETFEKDAGTYMRIPDADDTLERGGQTQLAQSDLLPIQQLARLDDDMLDAAVDNIQSRLAARVWADHEADTSSLWQQGSGEVREFFDASDLRIWIHQHCEGITDSYAKKLVSRTLTALQDYTNNRLHITKKTHRKDGLRYKERRVTLRSDVEIPGETTAQRQ